MHDDSRRRAPAPGEPGFDNQRALRDAVAMNARYRHVEALFHEACPNCDAEPVHAVAGYMQSNGIIVPRVWCEVCGVWITTAIGGIPPRFRTTDYLVVVEDNSANAYTAECERCHAIGPVERHHWAPRSLFDDADDWPISELCVECHVRWHQTTGVATGRKAA